MGICMICVRACKQERGGDGEWEDYVSVSNKTINAVLLPL